MFTVTIAVDLAKHVFELAVASGAGRVTERKRLSRTQFEQFWALRAPCRVVMEACATAHFWARHLRARGFEVSLLPPHHVKAYRRRNKTDRADCEALLEADRCAGIKRVAIRVKTSRRSSPCTAAVHSGRPAARRASIPCAACSPSSA